MSAHRRGFTMMELLVVVAIIGVLLSFILAAAMNASRAAEERATQALIVKLDTGLGDRLEALLQQQVNPSMLIPGDTPFSRNWPAALWWCQANGPWTPPGAPDSGSYQRAGVLARYDQIKNEVPDVFAVQYNGSGALPPYPLNFAMTPYNVVFTAQQAGDLDLQCVYPIGTGAPSRLTFPQPPQVGLGIWGVTYQNLDAFYKNLGKYTDATNGQTHSGFIAKGYDGVDSNGNTFIDDIGESGGDGSIADALNNHQHVTARAEALYAFLVEGNGQYGTVFNRDDFTNREVRDTDNDGLPEFVDAWGKPLQFYRWPIFYHSDVQRGIQFFQTGATEKGGNQNAVYGLTDQSGNVATPYGRGPIGPGNLTGALDARENNPLDQNQQLLSPGWWSGVQNTQAAVMPIAGNVSPTASAGVAFFQTYFHQLNEPLFGSTLGQSPCLTQRYWDRSVPGASFVPLFGRRAFYSRFLILSSGPDGKPGTPYLTDPRFDPNGTTPMFTDPAFKGLAASNPANAASLLMLESQAAQASLVRSTDGYEMPSLTNSGPYPQDGDYWTNALQNDGQDDITNHNLQSSALPVQ